MNDIIPLSVPDLTASETYYVTQSLADNWVSSAGPSVTLFEQKVASYVGCNDAAAVSSGSAALLLALKALGVGAGDKVIVPDWTFAATANAVIMAGASPVFVDINENGWCIDASSVFKALQELNGIRAVIAVDPLGMSYDVSALNEVCSKFDVPVIEDAAGALGSKAHERFCGTSGTLGIFSFNGNKVITTGGGGMVVSNDATLIGRVKHLAAQARSSNRYLHDAVGFNFRMPSLNAALGLAQMSRLEDIIARRKKIELTYDKELRPLSKVRLTPRPAYTQSNGWMYSVQVTSSFLATDLVNFLGSKNIEARIFWESLSNQLPWQAYPRSSLMVSQQISGTVVSLPSSSSLSLENQNYVIQAIREWSVKCPE
ncbi:aminotransferase class I/II-fold pyridoxal phosphate-dependent enzyme [Paracoccaceae bacterium]|nr:aminotransferase class I/II-fold pyridoxal phosphate-dependent enzyme [Paracoccaceae bacterium]